MKRFVIYFSLFFFVFMGCCQLTNAQSIPKKGTTTAPTHKDLPTGAMRIVPPTQPSTPPAKSTSQKVVVKTHPNKVDISQRRRPTTPNNDATVIAARIAGLQEKIKSLKQQPTTPSIAQEIVQLEKQLNSLNKNK